MTEAFAGELIECRDGAVVIPMTIKYAGNTPFYGCKQKFSKFQSIRFFFIFEYHSL